MSIEIKKGNYGIDLEFEVKNPDGTPFDLTGYTVTLKVWKPGKATLSLSATCEIIDAANGKCRYTVKEGDFQEVGDFYAELELTKAGVCIDTETFGIKVVRTAP